MHSISTLFQVFSLPCIFYKEERLNVIGMPDCNENTDIFFYFMTNTVIFESRQVF